MMPFFGLDLGRELGSIDSRLTRMENDIQKLDAKIDMVDSKLSARIDAVDSKLSAKIDAVDSRVDKCLVTINRLDEGRKSDRTMLTGLWAMVTGLWVTVIAGFIIQFFK